MLFPFIVTPRACVIMYNKNNFMLYQNFSDIFTTAGKFYPNVILSISILGLNCPGL